MMKKITPENLKQQGLGKNDLIIDVRSPEEYKRFRVKGAKNIPVDQIDAQAQELKKYDHVYVYCASGMRSERACQALKRHELDNMTKVDGGVEQMQKAGLEFEGKKTLPMMRQVMLAAGSLILLSFALHAWVHPNWIYLALFVGLGLTNAGVTGYCGMSSLLSKMPWNK